MARRKERNPFAVRLGQRLRALRLYRKMSPQQMVWAADIPGTQHLMDIEEGLSSPSRALLAKMARVLGVDLSEVVLYPEEGPRHRLLELVRYLTPEIIERLMDEAMLLLDREETPSS
jgi:transcriptional regulator with XRE-family HTH domain